MKMRARAPTSRAAHATAWPWLPALAATTPARAARVVEARELVVRAAHLERARALEVLRLEPHLPARELRERLRAVDRRDARDAVEPLARALDVSQPGCV